MTRKLSLRQARQMDELEAQAAHVKANLEPVVAGLHARAAISTRTLSLADFAEYCRAMTEVSLIDNDSRLWVRLAGEIDDYLGVHDADEPGLFDAQVES